MSEIKLNKTDNRLWIVIDPWGWPLWHTQARLRRIALQFFDSKEEWDAHRKLGYRVVKVHLEKGWPE